MKRTIVGVISATDLFYGLLGSLLAAPANAAPINSLQYPVYLPTTTISIINKQITNKYVNKASRLGACTVGTNGASCTISVSRSYTNTWSTSFGVSDEWVASNLGISYAKSIGFSTTCNSPKMKKNETWEAFPEGTRATYKIKKVTNYAGEYASTNTSGTLTSFAAGKN